MGGTITFQRIACSQVVLWSHRNKTKIVTAHPGLALVFQEAMQQLAQA